jgi:hypothetical protein
MSAEDDLAQLRTIHARLLLHQYLALDVVRSADAFMDALFANRHADITACHAAYNVARAELEAAATARVVG